MRIGITYDTIEDYPNTNYKKYSDFASLTSISFLKREFEKAGFETFLIGSLDKLKKQLESKTITADIIYNTAEGIHSRNREGIIPALLEMYDFPYIGSDAYALSLSLNKYHSKILAEYCNVLTPHYEIIYQEDSLELIKEKLLRLHFPLVIKPNYEGSSMGLYLATTVEEAMKAISQDHQDYNQEVLCEEYIAGIEVTVPIIGTGMTAQPLDIIRFHRRDGSDLSLFDSDDKHYAEIYCESAKLANSTKQKIMEHALTMHRMLGCRDINRLDFRVDTSGNAFFLEMNPLPALDPDGSFVCAARTHGMDLSQLLLRLVKEAENRIKR